jgi:hypothetical protein
VRLHDVFHVGLKPYRSEPPTGPGLLPSTKHGHAYPQPAEIIKSWFTHGVQELLIRWEGQVVANATWVELQAFKAVFPSFQLEDELVLDGGRDVMTNLAYSRCCKKPDQKVDVGAR